MHVDRSEDWYLQIEDVQKEDAGTYECQGEIELLILITIIQLFLFPLE